MRSLIRQLKEAGLLFDYIVVLGTICFLFLLVVAYIYIFN
jgi:hypothetical protein